MGMPDFFIIGAPKCGTTTLYDWLGQHPQVHAPHKEPCFFSQDLESTAHLPTHIPTLEAYKSIFDIDNPNVLISGEATPKYLYSDEALDQISHLRPDAKIIICLRDPVDLVISFHNQKFREGVEPEKDFVKAWRRSVDRTGKIICHTSTAGGHINYFFWGAIGVRLQRVFEIFPTEQVLLVTLGEIKSDPKTTYDNILAFLGIRNDGRKDFSASNTGFKIQRPYLHRSAILLKGKFAPVVRYLHKLRGGRGLGVLKILNLYNTAPGDYRSDVPEEVRDEIQHVFECDSKFAEIFLQEQVLARSHVNSKS